MAYTISDTLSRNYTQTQKLSFKWKVHFVKKSLRLLKNNVCGQAGKQEHSFSKVDMLCRQALSQQWTVTPLQ